MMKEQSSGSVERYGTGKGEADGKPIARHPDNPRYFVYRGRPVLLITATEHYGAVANSAFDYEAYLSMLQSYGLNLTRIIVLFREAESEFKGTLGWQNTASGDKDRYLCPWARSAEPGCLDGGNKYDLTRWNEAYFTRLTDFCASARDKGIFVECTFFSQLYNGKEDSPWQLFPLNPANNALGVGATGFNRVATLENAELTGFQEALVRKVTGELAAFDNIYYEICNEPPYPMDEDTGELPADHPRLLGVRAVSEWHNYMAEVLAGEEAALGLGYRHMIAVGDPQEHVEFDRFDLYTYHYREWMEKGLRRHYDHGKPLAFDETLTGIVSWNREMDFRARRMEAWEFIMRGAAVYDYLDFTVTTDDPRGEGNVELSGGDTFDGTMMRLYLKALAEFMNGFDFVRMKPDADVARTGADTSRVFVLAEAGQAYAAYMTGSAMKYLTMELPAGDYRAEWFEPSTGSATGSGQKVSGGGAVRLDVPLYHEDIALKLLRI